MAPLCKGSWRGAPEGLTCKSQIRRNSFAAARHKIASFRTSNTPQSPAATAPLLKRGEPTVDRLFCRTGKRRGL